MERFNIEDSIFWVFTDLDIKPSNKNVALKALRSNNIWNIKDMCSKSEEELHFLQDLDDKLLKAIEKHLHEHGLSLGMSENELLEYQDAEYYEKHPEEKSQVNPATDEYGSLDVLEDINPVGSEEEELSAMMQRMKEEHNLFVSTLDKNQKKPVPLLDNTLKQKIRIVFERKSRADVKRRLTDFGYMRLDADDMEWVWVNYFRMFYLSQPWYIRLLKSKTARIELAKRDADKMRETHVQTLVSNISCGLTDKFCNSLDKDWNEHWELIMKDLGIE
jgi:hypothetical protein